MIKRILLGTWYYEYMLEETEDKEHAALVTLALMFVIYYFLFYVAMVAIILIWQWV